MVEESSDIKGYLGHFPAQTQKTQKKFMGRFRITPWSFHHCFFRCFHFTIDFYYCFWVFSLLIAVVHFITVSSGVFISPLILLLFFECHQLSLPCLFFVRYFVFVLLYRECYGFEKAFLHSGVFYLTTLPDIWHNLLLSRLPWGRQFCLEGCRASH